MHDRACESGPIGKNANRSTTFPGGKMNRKVFFMILTCALAAGAAPIYTNDYWFAGGTSSSTSQTNCNQVGVISDCVAAGYSSGNYLEVYHFAGVDPEESWSWSNLTADWTVYDGWWKNLTSSTDLGGNSLYVSLFSYDTESDTVGAWANSSGYGMFTDEQRRVRWEYTVSSMIWNCEYSGGPCVSSGMTALTRWGSTYGTYAWSASDSQGVSPYAFEWGPYTEFTAWSFGGGTETPEPAANMLVGLGLIGLVLALHRRQRLALARSLVSERR